MTPTTPTEARELLDDMDDYAKMGVSVDPFGPVEALTQFIGQYEAQVTVIQRLQAQIDVQVAETRKTCEVACEQALEYAREDERSLCAAEIASLTKALHDWLAANQPDGWIGDLREHARSGVSYMQQCTALTEALKDIALSGRTKTGMKEMAREALGWSETPTPPTIKA